MPFAKIFMSKYFVSKWNVMFDTFNLCLKIRFPKFIQNVATSLCESPAVIQE